MVVTCVTVRVKPENREEFIRATVENHENSVKEPGNLRFDFLECADDPGRFFLYEAYDSEESAKAHKETAHYAKWRDTVAPYMAAPREGVKHFPIRPLEKKLWK